MDVNRLGGEGAGILRCSQSSDFGKLLLKHSNQVSVELLVYAL